MSVIRAEKGYSVITAKEPEDKKAAIVDFDRGSEVIAWEVGGSKPVPITTLGRAKGDFALRTPAGTYERDGKVYRSPPEVMAAMNEDRKSGGNKPMEEDGVPKTQQQADQAVVSGPNAPTEKDPDVVRNDAFNTVPIEQVEGELELKENARKMSEKSGAYPGKRK